MHLSEYQLLAGRTDQQPKAGISGLEDRTILVPLLGLAGEVGRIARGIQEADQRWRFL